MRRQLPTEQEILHQALNKLQDNTGLRAEGYFPDEKSDCQSNPIITINISQFPCMVKPVISPASSGPIISRFSHLLPNGILVTRYVTPSLAETLRENGIQFLDAAGNAYLNAPPIFVFIKGNRLTETIVSEKTKRAFRPSGLQFVFTLLLKPSLLNAPYREIAKTADVALGTITWIMRDLEELGYLIKMGKRGRRLVRKAELLDRWVTAYPEQLRPKLVLGKFSPDSPGWQATTGSLTNACGCWGGELAAAHLTGMLKPQTATVYVRESPKDFVLHNRLRKDPHGKIEILKQFWNDTLQKECGHYAPPLVVYADLLATADPRNLEIAKIIYEQKIIGLVRED